MNKIKKISMIVVLGIALSGCTSFSTLVIPNGEQYVYNNIDFGTGRNGAFKQGVVDACRTADGHYTKDHNLFNTDINYKSGWENGRLKCKGKS